MFLKTMIVTVFAASITTTGVAAGFSSNSITGTGSGYAVAIGFLESGKRRLKRLLRPHIGPLTITRAARAAIGDPNIMIIDRRHAWGEVYSCSFLNIRKNQRALVCD